MPKKNNNNKTRNKNDQQGTITTLKNRGEKERKWLTQRVIHGGSGGNNGKKAQCNSEDKKELLKDFYL